MCGIVGISWHDQKALRTMRDLIAYRGPDDCGEYFDNVTSPEILKDFFAKKLKLYSLSFLLRNFMYFLFHTSCNATISGFFSRMTSTNCFSLFLLSLESLNGKSHMFMLNIFKIIFYSLLCVS